MTNSLIQIIYNKDKTTKIIVDGKEVTDCIWFSELVVGGGRPPILDITAQPLPLTLEINNGEVKWDLMVGWFRTMPTSFIEKVRELCDEVLEERDRLLKRRYK